jgi:ribosomal protein L11 methylase PrmA
MTDPLRHVRAPYLPTPPDVVERMIRLADVQPGDTVYDLGCGDGRIVIAAAKRGAKGVGVDLDAERVEEARRGASRARVAALARFEQCDLFEVDLAPATVIFLYLLRSSMSSVAAHLLRSVTPGTRIVAHGFPIDFMTPAAVEQFVDEEQIYRVIYLWVVDP